MFLIGLAVAAVVFVVMFIGGTVDRMSGETALETVAADAPFHERLSGALSESWGAIMNDLGSDATVERNESEASKIYKTEDGESSVEWVRPPTIDGNTILMEAVLDTVVSTEYLSVTLFHQSEGSGDRWCDLKGKPWAGLVRPLQGNLYYVSNQASMYCVYAGYGSERVRGDTRPTGSPMGQEFRYTAYEADVWRIDGKRFTVGGRIPGLDRAGTHSVLLLAGNETLAVYEIRSHQENPK